MNIFDLDGILIYKKKYTFLLIIFITCLLPRILLWSFGLSHHINLPMASPEDATSYIQAGYNIFAHHFFSYDMHPPYHLDSFRTPIYPLLSYLFSYGLSSLWFLSLVQYIVVFLSAIILFHLTQRVTGSMRAAQIASVLFVLEPYFIFWSGLAMAEVFFLFFLLYTMYALFDAILHEKKWSYLLSGFFFGIASLTRPVLLPFFFLLMPILVWLFRRKLRAQLVSIAFLVVGFAIIVAPWSLRNHRLFGSWNISSVGSYNLIFYDSALSLSTYNHIPWDDTIAYLQGRVSQSCSNLITYTSLRYESRLTHTFLELVKENPIAFAKMRVKNIASVLLNDGYNHIGRFLSVSIPFWTRIIGILFWASQYVLIVIYVFSQDFQKLSKNQKYFIFILLSMIAYFAFATGAVASARYRIPIAPFIFLLSSSSISLVYKKIKLHL